MIYLDNASTMTKLPAAIRAEQEFYQNINANPLRGLYENSVLASQGVEECRQAVLDFVHASDEYTVIFTRGATEALNIAAHGLYGGEFPPDGWLQPTRMGSIIDDRREVIIDIESHHSNLLPWCRYFETFRQITDFDQFLLGNPEIPPRMLFALTATSNVTGEDFSERIKTIRQAAPNSTISVDAAQAVSHGTFDVTALDADFVAFSGHKLGAPMGVGCLVAKKDQIQYLEPFCYGGEMVEHMPFEYAQEAYTYRTEGPQNPEIYPPLPPAYAPVPSLFEAGTLPVGAIFGLKAALEELSSMDLAAKTAKITQLVAKTADEMCELPGVRVLAANGTIITFQVEDVHPHDVAQILASQGVAVRAGWLCAQPFLEYKEWGPVVRASFSIFNTPDDAAALISATSKVRAEMGL